MIRRMTAMMLTLMLILGLLPTWAGAAELGGWNRKSPYPTAQGVNSVVYGGNKFVAVGYNGVVLTSVDGVSWDNKSSGTTNNLSAITYGNGLYVAVGYTSTDYKSFIMTSVDGSTWTPQVSNKDALLLDVTYANGVFVAVGGKNGLGGFQSGTTLIMTSSDGITWVATQGQGVGRDKQLSGITYGNGTFVAVGGESTIFTSSNGTNWSITYSQPSSPFGPRSPDLIGATYDGNKFIVVGLDGKMLISTNGSSWTDASSGTKADLYRIASPNEKYFLFGRIYENFGYRNIQLTSTDGNKWEEVKPAPTRFISKIIYAQNTYVAVGERGTILTSSDGKEWVSQTRGITESLQSIIYSGGKYIAVGGYSSAVYTSDDGNSWTTVAIANDKGKSLNRVKYINGHYATVSQYGEVLFSPDGLTWSAQNIGNFPVYDITYSKGQYFTANAYGKVYVSSDGVKWTSTNSNNIKTLFGITSNDSLIVAVGENGAILSSSDDGKTWVSQKSNVTVWIKDVTYSGGVFVAVGFTGTILTSTDGTNWTIRTSGVTANLSSVKYINGQFVAVGGNTVLTSLDGKNWTPIQGAESGLSDVAFDGHKYVFVGLEGAIFTLRYVPQAALNTVSINPSTTAVGQKVTLETSGDLQSMTKPEAGDERFIASSWSSTEAGKSGAFSVTDAVYSYSDYTPQSPGNYTVTVMFTKQKWDGGAWVDTTTTDTKTAIVTVNGDATPSAPTALSATAGDGQVTLNWNSVSGAASYLIIWSTTSGDYSNDSNSKRVSSDTTTYTLPGLKNGTTYYFKVRASNTNGNSPFSAEVSTTPKAGTQNPSSNANLSGLTLSSGTVSPSFDANTTNYAASVANSVSSVTVTAAVYDPAATVTVNGTAATIGQASAPISLSVGSNTITVIVKAQDGSTKPYTITVKRASASSDSTSGSPSTPSSGDQGAQTGFRVIVDGKSQDHIATGSTTKENGQTVLTATVDPAKLAAQLATAGDKPIIVISASTTSADKVTVVLTGDAVKAMENKQVVLEIQTPNGNYKLPAAQIVIDRLASQFGGQVKLSDIVVHVDIAKSEAAKAKVAESTAEKGKFTVVVPPIDFTVTALYNGKTVDVDKFSSYVKREIPLPDGVDPSKITTAIVLGTDGTTRHVPTYITARDGKYYAVVSSLTNSTYTLILHRMAFMDVEGHWAKGAVNDMASRMVVGGVDAMHYNPDAAITRAEFAAIIVRALGLADNGKTSTFGDVKSGDWYVGAVAKAKEYGIIEGYEDGTFEPTKTISREEAMAMIARVMKWTGLNASASSSEAESALASFTDGAAVDAWAKQAVAATVRSGLVQGRDAELKPMSDITRAETAAIVQRMLEKAKLIDNRNSK
ncbi:hypothetical protein GCM10008018_46300 [Paenibacillus marchantiophytorum]|uniref:Fibronectin type-III domain-containing protein n=1 Tax=Paenibacillus marchantiophytorum TaxID=1619310 RepID=A0ABQ1EZF8_9BACL|nr:S-layer homology domain-containing protein [Paenibacillus marchantiophytorum]GFZ94672.1 hypothetical protein GCM10008018_46300 [Paenibacillus marchantiophytorum]